MDSKITNTAVFFLATMVGSCVVMGGFLYFDKGLRRRVRNQANDILDISEQVMDLTKRMIGSFVKGTSSLDDQIIEIDGEWAAVYGKRSDF